MVDRPDGLDLALNLARLLAHVKEDTQATVMRVAGWKAFPGGGTDGDNETPPLSETRFRRLMLTDRGGEEQLTAFVRLVKLIGGAVRIESFASDFLYWGDKVKHRWAFDYYAVSIAAPEDAGAALAPNQEGDE